MSRGFAVGTVDLRTSRLSAVLRVGHGVILSWQSSIGQAVEVVRGAARPLGLEKKTIRLRVLGPIDTVLATQSTLEINQGLLGLQSEFLKV